jgi:hypothetical protein
VGNNRTIVVGAGPAGLIAAGQAAGAGSDTILLEKMDQPGRKLRLTGKGRCNLTNIDDVETFIEHIHPEGRFLHSAFSRFFTHDLMAFLESLGVETLVERGGRVFPVSEDAQHVVEALVRWAISQGVDLRIRSRVTQLERDGERIVGVNFAESPSASGASESSGRDARSVLNAESVVLATGGASYPGTGSTGDGYRLAASVGHTIVPIRPALVPIQTAGDTAGRLQGLSLHNVRASVLLDGHIQDEAFGEMLFTHFGLSGPIILTLSRGIVDALQAQRQVSISIDLKPALDDEKLDRRLLRDLDQHGNQHYHTLLKGLLPRKLIPVCIEQTAIPDDKPGNQITAEERERLRRWLKDFRFEVVGHRSFDQAIVTAGGVATGEIDPRTMASRLVDGLYFAGEIIDVDGDTGGYNLQAAFSTGWLAGRTAGAGSHR